MSEKKAEGVTATTAQEENTPASSSTGGGVEAMVGKVVLPGDVLGRIDATFVPKNKKLRIGAGVMQHKDYLLATKAGVVRNKGARYWIESHQKRYVPAVEDMVLGVVLERHSDNAKVDIGSANAAVLPILAFEGASRKNIPNLQVGTLVYARVVVANKDMEPELVCTAPNGKAEGFGILSSGYMFKCSLNLAKDLLASNNVVLQSLGKVLPFEIAVGQNGRVWVHSNCSEHTTLVSNAILNSEHLRTANQVRHMVDEMLKRMVSSSSS
ncbi:Ribosomal RNA-processing protein 40 [Balamuthia mandrillaris]